MTFVKGDKFRIGIPPPNKQIKTLIHCKNCKKDIFVVKSLLRIKFCSYKCYWSDMKKRSGDITPNWKGGITNKDRLERLRFRREIQKTVFKRDDYTCQICGIRGKDMTVDHIQSWKEYVELRFNLENCRTLCVKCHYKITFGKPMPPTVRAWGHNLLKGGFDYSIRYSW